MTWPSESPVRETPRIVLNAVEGWGKTTAGAYAPDPVILMASGETGYTTLYGAGLVPRVPVIQCDSWSDTISAVRSLCDDPQNRKTIILDALIGFEQHCHQFVCDRDFGGNWGGESDKGFVSWAKGYDIAAKEWLVLLAVLDRIRAKHKVVIVMLSHSIIRPFKNPMGDDFDRYVADCHHKTWGNTHKWADVVLFGTFVTVVKDASKGKGKAVGTNDRVIYTERRDAFDAKNRLAMPESLDIPNDRTKVWSTIWNAINGESK